MIPMRGTRVGCCAYAATGHAAAAPPNSLMDWRLVTWSMGSPPEPAVPAYRTLRLPWKHRQVLGLDLNCSESKVPGAPGRSGRCVIGLKVRPSTTTGAMSGLPLQAGLLTLRQERRGPARLTKWRPAPLHIGKSPV